MRMSNKDKIKALTNQNELLLRLNAKLRGERESLIKACSELSQASEAVILSCALRNGERREDDDGTLLGYRLNIGNPSVEALADYVVRVEKQGEDQIVGVFPRDEEEK